MFAAIVRFRFVVIAATFALTCLFAMQLPDLQLDPDTEAYVPEGHPIRVYWSEAKDRFGIGREILVAVVTDTPNGIFTVARLNAIARLDEAVKNVDGVFEADVSSIANSDAMVGTEEGLEVEPLMEAPVETAAQAEAIRAKAYDNPVYLDRLISRDGSIATIIVKTHHDVDVEETEIHRRIVAEAARHEVPGARILVAGSPAVEYVYGRQMTADLNRLIPLALLVVVVTLFACFPTISLRRLCLRSLPFALLIGAYAWTHDFPGGWSGAAAASVAGAMLTTRGALLPCIVVAVSVIWTWGLQALLGLPIYIAGTLVPPLLLAIGCADGIHVLERYYDVAANGERSTNRRTQIVIETMNELWRPVVLTSITTAIGFGSLMLGRMTVYRVFGFTTAFGILVAMLVSLTLLPAVLAMLPLPVPRRRGPTEDRLGKVLARWAEWIEGHRRTTVGISLAIVTFFAYSSRALYVDYSWVESLAPGTDVLAADRVLRTRHGGTMPMNLIIRAPAADGMKDPVLLRGVDRVLTELATDPDVGDTRSIAEYVARMNQAMNEDRPEELRIPETRELVAQ
ncbi:MAG TPA: efflux RND transporter permease subunit, partial [Vicinamibacterales bacterium]|nr:efflux RND transporter permease subunit [Vicinamibacterales bacterium]